MAWSLPRAIKEFYMPLARKDERWRLSEEGTQNWANSDNLRWTCQCSVLQQVHKRGNELQTIRGLEKDLQVSKCVQHHLYIGPSAEAGTTVTEDHILSPSQADFIAGRL
ncbi:hypothetical protein WJX77_005778 [Trebouxia sp. C0004]